MPAYRFDSTRVFTNKPCCGPKRGHGSVQPRFAFECQLDKLAEAIGIDPIELRRRNFIGENTRTVNGMRVTSNGFLAVPRRGRARVGLERRSSAACPTAAASGVAGSMYISGTNYCIYPNEMPQSAVQLKLDRSGRVTVFCGASDIGQGVGLGAGATSSPRSWGSTLRDVRVVAADTDLTPVDLGAYSSRETFMVGNACLDAARKLRGRVARGGGRALGRARRGEVALAGGVACCDAAIPSSSA